MKKLVPLFFTLFLSCKKESSGKIEISVIGQTSVTIKNGTSHSIDLLNWRLTEKYIAIATGQEIENETTFRSPTPIQKGGSVTYSAGSIGFALYLISKISLYDNSGALVATN